jgi:DNA-binding response OmpR family regulator
MAGPLDGLRVLVAEDDFHIAMLLEEQLVAAGSAVAGPYPRVAEALAAAAEESCDAAVLDINLGGARVFGVADTLARRGVPFLFVTGCDAGALPREYADRPRLGKPFHLDDLVRAIALLVRRDRAQ